MRELIALKLEPVTILSSTYMSINKVQYEECKINNAESALIQKKPS